MPQPSLLQMKSRVTTSGTRLCAGLIRDSEGFVSESMRILLRKRLALASVIIGIGVGLFLVRELLLGSTSTKVSFGVTFLLVLIAGGLLFSPLPLTIRKLRLTELAIFVLPALLLCRHQSDQLLQAMAEGSETAAVLALFIEVLICFWLMILYGFLVPNCASRAAGLICFLAIVPFLATLGAQRIQPELGDFLTRSLDLEKLTLAVVILALGAVASIAGTHSIDTLRGEAFRALRFGQYRLTDRLGSGGMGEVWKAEHAMLARPAVIKLIRPETLGVSEDQSHVMLSRFEREVQATATLRSPHTVQVYDFGIAEDGTFYYVMEMLHGLDLETLVRKYGPVPCERAIFLLAQVCCSLEEAHQNGLIHRDIKPANLFTCQLGINFDFVKTLDFGLVKSQTLQSDVRLTLAGTAAGTPAYMAPEVALGLDEVDARTDIYSLGCVAYWLLTGQVVFESGSSVATVVDHIQTAPIPPSKRTELPIPEELETIVLACLAKKPSERPATAHELYHRLLACTFEPRWTSETARKWWRDHGLAQSPEKKRSVPPLES